MAILDVSDNQFLQELSLNKANSSITLGTEGKYLDKNIQLDLTITKGSAVTPATTITALPSISVSSGGLITAANDTTASVVPTIATNGWVSSSDNTTYSAGTITVDGTNTSQLDAAEIISSDVSITSGNFTFDGILERFTLSSSETIDAPTVISPGFITSTMGDKYAGTASVSIIINKIVGENSIIGTTAVTPIISAQVIADPTITDAHDTSNEATTTPIIGQPYVAVRSAQDLNTIVAHTTVTSDGYGTTVNHGLADSISYNAGANASAITYIPVSTATPAFTGGGLIATDATATFTNAVCGSTDTSGIAISTAGTAIRSAVTYNGSVHGWVDAENDTTALSDTNTLDWAGTTYYLNSITLAKSTASRTLAMTLPNGGSTITLNITVSPSGDVTIT